MKRDRVFASEDLDSGDFEFNEEVADVFDDMVERSVPFYAEQQRMIREIAKVFWLPGTTVCDLGCATATTVIGLGRDLPAASIVGIDNSWPMIDLARAKVRDAGLEDRVLLRHGDLNGSPGDIEIENASVVTLCWTLQFVQPDDRQGLIRHIYESLLNGGVLVVTEKILTNHADTDPVFVDFYYDYKRRRGYSELEIAKKREALEDVMIPYRMDENLEMLQGSGFEVVEPFFQWYNFAGILCMKKSGSSKGVPASMRRP